MPVIPVASILSRVDVDASDDDSDGVGTSFAVGRNVTGCGDGYYYVLGGTYVWNGGWVGGWLWHDYRWYDY